MTTPDVTHEDLLAAGWRRTASGRYVHPALPAAVHGRRRLFTEAEAATLFIAALEHGASQQAEPEVPA